MSEMSKERVVHFQDPKALVANVAICIGRPVRRTERDGLLVNCRLCKKKMEEWVTK